MADRPSTARFIWTEAEFTPSAVRRNVYADFRRTFELQAAPKQATLSIFADTRYRLLVNGQVVGHGPCRFFAHSPRCDTWDVAEYLRKGDNVIAVQVNSYATQSFHAELHRGGLIAWLEVDGKEQPEIVTDGQWRCRTSPIHNPYAPRLSFALNPGEYADTREDEGQWVEPGYDDAEWSSAIELSDSEAGTWGPLASRPIAFLDESRLNPAECLGRWALRPTREETVHSVVLAADPPRALMNYYCAAVWWTLVSPSDQQVESAMTPCKLWVNDELVELAEDPPAFGHHRRLATVNLRKGVNHCFAWRDMGCDVWDFAIGLPAGADIALGDVDGNANDPAFTIGGPYHVSVLTDDLKPDAPLDTKALPDPLNSLNRQPATEGHVNACRDRAWCLTEPLPGEGAAPSDPPSVAWLYDMGQEYLGRVDIEFEAEAGTELQFSFGERREDDGAIRIHQRPHVDMLKRLIARGGRQRWLGFHPRGGRYLEVRVIGRPERFKLHDLSIRKALYPMWTGGRFECNDQLLNRIWQIGKNALMTGVEDAYLDTPCRERGTYVGDNLVQFEIDVMLQSDHRICRRSVELFLEAQSEETGLVPPCPHGLEPGKHVDYSAIMFQCARRYTEINGDFTVVTDLLPRWKKLAEGLMAVPKVDGLYNGEGYAPYIDISQHRNREPVSFAVNAYMLKAFVDAAWAFDRAGQSAEAAKCQAEADRLLAAIRNVYWDATRGVYVDLPVAREADQEPSIHSNVLAILYDIADSTQLPTIDAWLIPTAANNFMGQPSPPARNQLRCNAYFSFFLLQAMAKLGRVNEALDYIRTCWGFMVSQGAWNTWESFGGDRGGSLSHAWAAAPTWFLSSIVPGVKSEDLHQRADVEDIAITPALGDLEWAEAVLPRPDGRQLELRCEASEGRATVTRCEETARDA